MASAIGLEVALNETHITGYPPLQIIPNTFLLDGTESGGLELFGSPVNAICRFCAAERLNDESGGGFS